MKYQFATCFVAFAREILQFMKRVPSMRLDVVKISTSIGKNEPHKCSSKVSRVRAPRNSSEARRGSLDARRYSFSAEHGRTFFPPDSSPGMVIRHATSSTRDALIPAFFRHSLGINL